MPSFSYSEPTFKDSILSILLVLITITIIVFSGFFILERYGFFIWLIIVGSSLALLVKWHSSSRGFKCKHCGHEFSITFWQDLPTANSILFHKVNY